jgi:hypothetical protein
MALPIWYPHLRKKAIIGTYKTNDLYSGHDYPYSEVVREADKDYTDLSDPAVVLLVVRE